MEADHTGGVKNQVIATIIANGILISGGMASGWSSPINSQIIADDDLGECSYHFCVTKNEMAWILSTISAGSLAMGLIAGPLMTAVGRKLAILIYLILTFLGWMSLTFAQNSLMLFIGRFLHGAGFGGGLVVLPVFVGEISDTHIRGKLCSFSQFSISIGVLISYLCGYLFRATAQNVISLIIVGLFSLGLFVIPESPRYLVFNDRIEDAKKSIAWLRGKNFNSDKLIQEIQASQGTQEIKGLKNLFTERANFRALLAAVILISGLQISGYSGILYYSASIFTAANVSIKPDLAALFIAGCGLFGVIFSSLLVDKAGRRTIVLFASSIMFLCLSILGIFFVLQNFNPELGINFGVIPIISLCLFVFTVAAGCGNISLVVMSEVFAQNIKDTACGVVMIVNHILTICMTLLLPALASSFGFGVTFFVFASFIGITIILVIFNVPETKGKSFYEIQILFSKK